MSARILIVEDDSSIAAGLRLNLKHEGYQVRLATDGEAGLRAALEEPPDLVLLDVMMPKMNGYEALREMRRRGVTAAVIMLTAKALEEDKVLGLELGADDYVAKPFGLPELLARVKAVLRRRLETAPVTVTVGRADVDVRARSVRAGDEEVALSPREMSLLLFLIEHKGRALSRTQLLEGAWGLRLRRHRAHGG